MQKTRTIEPIMKILEKNFPTNKTTLNKMRKNPDAFKILISCLLSLRTQDKNTEIASKKLFAIAQTPEQILALPSRRLEKLIYSSGYYKNKAKTIKHVSKIILENFGGKVPRTREKLMSIKGIGPKTSNIVLAFAFGKKVLPIDTHCHRIPNRLGWVKTKTPEQTEAELNKILPEKYWTEFNSIFVQFGKTICQPVSPLCSTCSISKYCPRIGVTKSR
jgi:endonuclease-3